MMSALIVERKVLANTLWNASGITQNRPVRVTSKPANGEGLGTLTST